MGKSLREILREPENSTLCDGLFCLLADHYGNRSDVSELSEEERTVLLVWHAYGIIGNGGFQYLMEGDFDGDPGFRLTARAFRAIGCEPAADAFDRVLSLFPGGEPQADIEERIRHYREQFEEFPTWLDQQFFAADDAIESCLAGYIRSHASAFAHLE